MGFSAGKWLRTNRQRCGLDGLVQNSMSEEIWKAYANRGQGAMSVYTRCDFMGHPQRCARCNCISAPESAEGERGPDLTH